MCVRGACKINDHRHIAGWFATEVLPHEADVRAWLRSVLRITNEDDVIQEAYCRIFAHARTGQVDNGRAYLFTVTRNVVLQQMRRDRVVRIEAVAEIDSLGIVDYEPSAERAVSGRQELARVQRLMDQLPERCRTIFQMRKIDALSQREIAARLGVSENIVEKEAARGLRLILRGLGEEGGSGRRQPFNPFKRRRGHEARNRR